MRGGSLSAAALAFAVAATAWHFGAPWWTLRDMRAAAEARDAGALARHVDFPALRDSLKSELAAAMIAAAASEHEELSALGAALGLAMLDPVVDGMVSPKGLRLLFAAEPPRGGEATPVAGLAARDVAIDREGFSTFRVTRVDDPAAGALVFRRSGYVWRLAAVDLPDPLPARTADRSPPG